MNPNTRQSRRRRLLGAPFVALAGWLLLPGRRAHAQQKATLLAKLVTRVPAAPEDPAWQSADALDVPPSPQAVVKPRSYAASITGVAVRALYDESRLALRLEWRDAAGEAMKGGVSAFRDALALEFPSDPKAGIPFFGMGEPNRPVTIYQWKSDWQPAPNNDVDEKYPNMAVDWYPFSGRGPGEIAEPSDYGSKDGDRAFPSPPGRPATRSPIRRCRRSGRWRSWRRADSGTVAAAPADRQDGEGKAVWKDGVWTAVVSIPRGQEQFTFARGQTVPVAFAAWDGAERERGGEKAVSTWYFLSLEQPVGALTYAAPVLALAGVAAIELAGLRVLRARRAARNADETPRADGQGWIADLRARFSQRGKTGR
ncbi:MAG: ethylbenzene dehydrogenase-related protein [Burkholderiales bacterium]|nr:ethylbenzene dehydrogenase-related protein [Burkholderiales bacterium]